jgi:NADPH:quinone reductase-like Zn-dependent oxidoreductase
MKQLVLTRYGKRFEKCFKFRDGVSPVLSRGSVRVRVVCAGVSFTDVVIARGLYAQQRRHVPLPLVIGFEFSGEVLESFESNFSKGDRVFGITKFGAFAEEVVVHALALRHMPSMTSYRDAASIPVAFATAYIALQSVPPTVYMRSVAVTGASGGVGGMLVRLLVQRGVAVTAVVSDASKFAACSASGAASVITRDEFYMQKNTYDAIFLNDGVYTNWLVTHALRIGGAVVVYGFHSLVHASWWGRLRGVARMLCFGPFTYIEKSATVASINIIQADISTLGAALDACEKFMQQPAAVTRTVTEHSWRYLPDVLHVLASGKSSGKHVLRIAADQL